MKKTLVLSAVTLLGAVSVMAQGQIAFANTTAYPLKAEVTPGVTNIVGTASTDFGLGPASVRVGLLVGGNGDALSSMVPVVASNTGTFVVTNSPLGLPTFQGIYSGDQSQIPTGFSWSDGNSAIQFAYVAWQIAGSGGIVDPTDFISGNTMVVGQLGFYSGWSGIVQGYMPGHGVVITPPTYGTGTGQLNQSVVLTIPEPATFALAGLGAAAILIFRRRK